MAMATVDMKSYKYHRSNNILENLIILLNIPETQPEYLAHRTYIAKVFATATPPSLYPKLWRDPERFEAAPNPEHQIPLWRHLKTRKCSEKKYVKRS